MSGPLFPALRQPSARPALRFSDRALTYSELADAAGAVMEQVAGHEGVAVWATPHATTAVAVVGVLTAGRVVIPVGPAVAWPQGGDGHEREDEAED